MEGKRMGYVKEKFPCGYEVESKSLFLTFENDEGCPLHGKACKK
jgi:hypothetical protein